ncbi:MAG: hypothetical protein U0T72_02190 [Chitinophagales bacterium]
MDKLVDHLFVFEGNGEITDFPGNYTQYRNEVLASKSTKSEPKAIAEPTTTQAKPEQNTTKRKLSFKEKSEFEKLEKELPTLESRKTTLNEQIAAGNLPYEKLQPLLDELATITTELESKELRWLELSEIA